jgi:hypothetical protein
MAYRDAGQSRHTLSATFCWDLAVLAMPAEGFALHSEQNIAQALLSGWASQLISAYGDVLSYIFLAAFGILAIV